MIEALNEKSQMASILCVDDELPVLNALARCLRHIGNVYIEQTALAALEIIKSQEIDILILDMKMPAMSGAALLNTLKSVNLPLFPSCVLITGYSDHEELASALNTGLVDRFLGKPWNNSELIFIVQELLKKRARDAYQRSVEIELQQRNLQLSRLLALVDRCVLYTRTDINGKIIEVSSAFSELLGYSAKELLGCTHRAIRHHKTPKIIINNMYSTLAAGESWSGEIAIVSKGGEIFWVDMVIEPELNTSGLLTNFTGFYHNITDKKRIEKLSNCDILTGIANRRKFEAEIDKKPSQSRRYGETFSIILLDIDYFKKINDTHGHQTGDEVLVEVAQLIKAHLRDTDLVARWGGEEFIILCNNTDISCALLLADKIRILIAQHKFPFPHSVTASFGVATYKSNENLKSLFKRADEYLYTAKNSGRNRIFGLA